MVLRIVYSQYAYPHCWHRSLREDMRQSVRKVPRSLIPKGTPRRKAYLMYQNGRCCSEKNNNSISNSEYIATRWGTTVVREVVKITCTHFAFPLSGGDNNRNKVFFWTSVVLKRIISSTMMTPAMRLTFLSPGPAASELMYYGRASNVHGLQSASDCGWKQG